MRRMGIWPVCAALVLGIGLLAGAGAGAEASGELEVRSGQVQAAGKWLNIKTVRIDMTDPSLRIEPVTAQEGIGYDESFESMLARTGAVAGINGTFFNAYEKDSSIRYPNGLMIASGEVLHSGENQSLLLLADKTAAFRQINLGVRTTFIHGTTTSTYFPWGINKYYGDQTDQVVWYTPAMGRSIDYPGTKIVIREKTVTAITKDAVEVPADGYVCLVGDSENNKTNLLPRIHVGDAVDVETVARDSVTGEAVDPGSWISAIGAGPKLVTGGSVDVDFKRDGFDDPKITTQSNRRSFVGIDREGRLVLGTIDGVTVLEEAEAALALGLTEAMNLDGGASSGLYAEGRLLTVPGRKLSNALVVRRMDNPQVQIQINGKFVPDFQGFIRSDTTMVPIRPLLRAMGAEFEWNGETRTLTVSSGGRTMVLRTDDRIALVNGSSVQMSMPPVLLPDGHLYLPLRFMIEAWGGKVNWDGHLYRADVELGG